MPVSLIKLAAEGPQVSRLVAGMMNLATWQWTLNERLNWIRTCLEFGITTFDHADIYGDYQSEELFGEVLASEPSLRGHLQLITKYGINLVSENRPQHRSKHYDTSKAHILASVDNSLQNLQTEVIDLLLIHRPDPLMDADEVAAAFYELRKAGKVLHFGVSNFTPWQFELLASRLDFPLVTNQVEVSVMKVEALHDGTLDFCQKLRIAPMAWAPLGGGELFKSYSEQATRVRDALKLIGDELGATPAQVAVAWLLAHPSHIIPVFGTGNRERLEEMVVGADVRLTREQWFTLWSASTGRRVP